VEILLRRGSAQKIGTDSGKSSKKIKLKLENYINTITIDDADHPDYATQTIPNTRLILLP